MDSNTGQDSSLLPLFVHTQCNVSMVMVIPQRAEISKARCPWCQHYHGRHIGTRLAVPSGTTYMNDWGQMMAISIQTTLMHKNECRKNHKNEVFKWGTFPHFPAWTPIFHSQAMDSHICRKKVPGLREKPTDPNYWPILWTLALAKT